MGDKDIKKLVALAKKLQKEISKEKAMSTFVAAGILDEDGDFTKQYSTLATAVSVNKK